MIVMTIRATSRKGKSSLYIYLSFSALNKAWSSVAATKKDVCVRFLFFIRFLGCYELKLWIVMGNLCSNFVLVSVAQLSNKITNSFVQLHNVNQRIKQSATTIFKDDQNEFSRLPQKDRNNELIERRVVYQLAEKV